MKLSFRSFLHERIECGDLLMISFCTGGFRYRQHIYYQHANNPASYVGSLILWLKKIELDMQWQSVFPSLNGSNHDVKAIHEAVTTSEIQNSSIQGS